MRRRACLLSLILLTGATLAACGGDDDDASAARDALEALEDGSISPEEAEELEDAAEDFDLEGEGTCTVEVTGDHQDSWEDDGGSDAAGSDYWYSEEDLEQALEVLGGEDTPEGQFAIYGLILNCQGDEGQGVSVVTTAEANKDNFPFGPGTYETATGLLGGNEEGALISAFVTLGDDPDVPLFSTSAGNLDIERFDDSGIKATLTLELEESFAEGAPRTAELVATFDFACPPDAC
jgi:hypothetical protein